MPEARHFSDILSHSPLAEAVRAEGSVSSDILSHSLLAEAARAGGTSLFGYTLAQSIG